MMETHNPTIEMISAEIGVSNASTVNLSAIGLRSHQDHVYGMSPSSTSSSSFSTSSSSSSPASASTSSSVPVFGPPTTSNPTYMSMRGRSRVWREFSVTTDGKKVTCHRCGDSLSYSNSHSTSSMLKHLKRKHSLDLYPPVFIHGDGSVIGSTSTLAQQTAEARNKFGNGNSSSSSEKKAKKKQAANSSSSGDEEMESSIQHGPLVFKDPCVRMKWTDHSETYIRTFSALYSDESYTDVTVVVEKQFFKAHRVILSSASDFFDESFRMTPAGQHPIIFLKDMKAVDFRILLDFIYKGEVSIPPSVIPGLAKIGSDLRVRGLSDFVWNDHLTPGYQPAKPPQQQEQAPQQTVISDNTRFVQQVPFNLLTNTDTIGNYNTVSQGAPLNVTTTPIRTLIRQPLQLQTIPLEQQGDQSTRLFPRIVNIQPQINGNTTGVVNSNATILPSTNDLQSQTRIINGDLNTVCSSVANVFPSMKHIRFVTSEARLTPQVTSVTSGNSTNVLGGISMADPATATVIGRPADTVLMVTNDGETLLSTTQGGVTLLTQPSSAMTIPLGQQVMQTFQQNTAQQQPMEQLRPVITSISSQSNMPQLGLVKTHQQEFDEVVYSIAEISNENDGRSGDSQVLMQQDSDMACQEPTEQAPDKKPFL